MDKTIDKPKARPGVGCTDLLADRPFFARYRQRTPDPGVCRIISIDWEGRHLSMSNGGCRYFPSFDEVEIIAANQGKDHA